ncbi:hypothetical protein MLD38_011467 [Melastoma candidum]|uniref:Uncharacterized protein n=1 Tax=Melastoma candidum TaxID=119954 RepID=A0ACB9R363_9MYRT|nr:hypothetical protein MLD38_011467 [Melastoma candidum]
MSGSSERSVVAVSIPGNEIDPLLKDLNEKKQNFRKNVVSLAAELNDVRRRLASREQLRQEAETRARSLEEEIDKLHHNWRRNTSKFKPRQALLRSTSRNWMLLYHS